MAASIVVIRAFIFLVPIFPQPYGTYNGTITWTTYESLTYASFCLGATVNVQTAPPTSWLNQFSYYSLWYGCPYSI